MIKSTSYAVIGAVMIANMVLPIAASAQTAATMPVLYNQSGMQINAGNTSALPAGYYYLGTGGTRQVYYYGNGTYFDPATGEFGGSVNNPSGQAGVNLGYMTNTGVYTGSTGTTGTTGSGSTPGVPNTGSGGD